MPGHAQNGNGDDDMAHNVKLEFKPYDKPAEGGDVVVFVGADRKSAPSAAGLLGAELDETIARAAELERFKGKAKSVLVLIAPGGLAADRLIVAGLGEGEERARLDWTALGGAVCARLSAGGHAHVLFEAPGEAASAENAADFALGVLLRSYRFDRYKTKKKDDDNGGAPARVTIHVSDPAAAKRAWKSRAAVADGVFLARDLVNEPPNVLYPAAFAERAAELSRLGVDVEILDEKALKKLGMRALLGVGQGSHNESRVVIMRWNGARDDVKPIAFVGKGVTFDTGGISIKPAQNMEDMKGDMAGAACVVGLMHALAARKAKVNAIGAIGLVENMPDGRAQRPGDIVTSMSGQTIEIVNTDAEGRLVLADVLWHVQDKYGPAFMVDLATLTGAILVALGTEHAGLFSNNDELAERIAAAGRATGEKVWRMPLAPEYDKLIDSKFADMKNTGGRNGGSITAAQFLQRFVNNTPWAHLDIAGTGMSSPSSDINQSWGSGWGVRLLDQLVKDHYES
ncbi:putative cytosol aminopeptidase [Chelatococcus composti]|jgi:leucyl aminopeptidase|uniref:Probable cytosol aminopeptidase n=2 Tax=Chelatococcus composti TaxID=1743235 RepID=A0A841K6T8_9HYPH|nr:leucyl aminopeptidase [Chelatococcus composti]GGG37968.1 putative cytosol aminopeptidase [Chelatococcus composti]